MNLPDDIKTFRTGATFWAQRDNSDITGTGSSRQEAVEDLYHKEQVASHFLNAHRLTA